MEKNVDMDKDRRNERVEQFMSELKFLECAARCSSFMPDYADMNTREGKWLLSDLHCGVYQELDQKEVLILSKRLFRARMTFQKMSPEGCSMEWFQSELDHYGWMWARKNVSWQDIHDTVVSLAIEGGIAPRNINVVHWDEDVTKQTQAPSEEISKIGGECGGGTAEGMGAAVGF